MGARAAKNLRVVSLDIKSKSQLGSAWLTELSR
jgi:hypothetical protein